MGDSDFKKKDGGPDVLVREKRRRRTVTVEPVSRSPRNERPAYQPREPREQTENRTERRSFNPNFSRDNKPLGTPRPERDFNRWDQGDQDRQGQGQYGKQGAYGHSQHGQQGQYGQRPPQQKGYGKKPYQGAGGGRPGRKPGGKYQSKERHGVMDPGAKPDFYPSYSVARPEGEVRLNRFIAMSGKCSRREADEHIQAGDVTVNGAVVTELGSKIKITDEVTFKGERLSTERKVYILMNKPKGYVTSVDDPHAEKTVMDIVKNACEERIYPVGRLDKSSVGVLLLTNDGDLTEKLTHPAHNKRKVYQVTLDAPLTNFDLQRARDGIDLEDGVIIPDAVEFVNPNNRKEVGIEIHSGRNRLVRRIFEELGYGVHKLDRVFFAGLTKKNLKRGQWRFLTDQEVGMLKSGRYE